MKLSNFFRITKNQTKETNEPNTEPKEKQTWRK